MVYNFYTYEGVWNHDTLQEERKSINTNSEMIEMLELSDKNFRAAIINMIQEVRVNSFETNEKIEDFRRKYRKYEKRKMYK